MSRSHSYIFSFLLLSQAISICSAVHDGVLSPVSLAFGSDSGLPRLRGGLEGDTDLLKTAEAVSEGAILYTTVAWGLTIPGVMVVWAALAVMWLNERRSAKTNTLLVRGSTECVSITADMRDDENRGQLVHVTGKTYGVLPISDPQFKDATVRSCLKLQSTVEVFEWVQTTRKMKGSKQTSFSTEWVLKHQDSAAFKKPSPENPRLPTNLRLGTFTTVNPRINLGAFAIPEEMKTQFVRFEAAEQYLPNNVSANGLSFTKGSDGYFYSKPSSKVWHRSSTGFMEPQVGDLRVRFMCIPNGEATCVAVQCERDGMETFVPYRPIHRGPCMTVEETKQRLIEEGERPFKEPGSDIGCATGGLASCCCCPCNAIVSCCASEVVTEEIFHLSENSEPPETLFQWVVRRSAIRVWTFRALGWALLFGGVCMSVLPYSVALASSVSLQVYGHWAAFVVSVMITVSLAAGTIGVAYANYRPLTSLYWLGFIVLVVAFPFIVAACS